MDLSWVSTPADATASLSAIGTGNTLLIPHIGDIQNRTCIIYLQSCLLEATSNIRFRRSHESSHFQPNTQPIRTYVQTVTFKKVADIDVPPFVLLFCAEARSNS